MKKYYCKIKNRITRNITGSGCNIYLQNVSILCILLSFIISLPLYAADSILLDEIVVKGTKLESNQENMTIREVREGSSRDIGEAMQNIPGITGLRKGAIANDIVLRGQQRDNINVLMDGVRVHGGCPSRMDPPTFHFDFAEVESIEVVKGPYDLRYSGSLGGLVNAIGKKPEPGSDVSAVLTYGSYDMTHAAATGSYADDTYAASGGYAYKYSLPPRSGDGKRITDIYPSNSKNRYRSNDLDSRAYDINTFWIKGGYRIAPLTKTELDISYQDADHVLYPALLMDAEYDRTSRFNWTTTIKSPVESINDVKLQIYLTDVDHLMHDEFRESSVRSAMVTRNYMMQTDAETTTIGSNLSGSVNLGSGVLLGGIDYFNRNWDAVNKSTMYLAYQPQPMIPDVDHNQFGVFGEYTRPLSTELKLKGGLRFDYAKSDATALTGTRIASLYQPYYPGESLNSENSFFEPSANLQLFWQAASNIELFAGLASVSRMPDPQELYIGMKKTPTVMAPTLTNWIGNPDLDPVRNNQADLGIKITGNGFYVNTSIFYSRIDDYINVEEVADPDGPGLATMPAARTYGSIDAELWGGELSCRISFPWNLYAISSLSYTRGENLDTDDPLAEIPPLAGSFGIRYDVDTWFMEITERFAGRQDRVDRSLEEEKTDGWGITDFKAGINLDHWTIFAGVNNVFDKHYFNHMSYQRDPFRSGVRVPEVGIFGYLTVIYKF
ncbi:MAG: iron complex outerrane recepter protein [Thermodesulfobacteriota bacterium]|nr:iron complex outerrane recepter protein [Thermodesulfobacteriota bacterium]